MRNYLVLQSGDTVLRTFLFWALFIPIAGNFSFDGFSGRVKNVTKVFSVGMLGIIFQVSII